MRSCPPLPDIKPFEFLPHSKILANFLVFKDAIFEKYSAEKYSPLRDLILSVALRQVNMNPSGPIYEVGANFFDKEGLAVALTGLILQLKDNVNNYFDSPKGFFSIVTNMTPFSFFSKRERENFNKKIEAIVGINEKNPLDGKTKKEIYSFLGYLERMEFLQKNPPKPNPLRPITLTLFAHGDIVTRHSVQPCPESPYTNRC